MVAFYADCRHEIKPVRSGYRMVLTYDLSVHGDTAGEGLTQGHRRGELEQDAGGAG